MNIPDKHDLTGKVAVVTGGGGVLCSTLARLNSNSLANSLPSNLLSRHS